MKAGIDIHDYPRRLELSLARMQRSDISDANKKHVLRFKDYCIAEGSIGTARTERYIGILAKWAQLLGADFDMATKEDIMRAVSIIQGNTRYSPWTKATYKIMFKRFYKWLKNSKVMPEEVEWISGKVKRNEITLPSNGDMLTEDDVKKMIKTCRHPRDKALIASLYESGVRIGELASMQIKNITFDKHGAVLNVHGKTGSRMIRIVASTSYLTTWIQNHPLADDPNAPLWINIGSRNNGQFMPYRAIWFLLRDTIENGAEQIIAEGLR